jgi:hypothetical protein
VGRGDEDGASRATSALVMGDAGDGAGIRSVPTSRPTGAQRWGRHPALPVRIGQAMLDSVLLCLPRGPPLHTLEVVAKLHHTVGSRPFPPNAVRRVPPHPPAAPPPGPHRPETPPSPPASELAAATPMAADEGRLASAAVRAGGVEGLGVEGGLGPTAHLLRVAAGGRVLDGHRVGCALRAEVAAHAHGPLPPRRAPGESGFAPRCLARCLLLALSSPPAVADRGPQGRRSQDGGTHDVRAVRLSERAPRGRPRPRSGIRHRRTSNVSETRG